jgi:hypothetical protein
MEQERRTEPRMLCADMVEVRWKERSGKQRQATALLEDISPLGACLQLDAPVPVGVEIGWDSPKQFFGGLVRYCVYREIGYFVGVEFEKSTRWSERAYKPQHLLDLRQLAAKARQYSADEDETRTGRSPKAFQ